MTSKRSNKLHPANANRGDKSSLADVIPIGHNSRPDRPVTDKRIEDRIRLSRLSYHQIGHEFGTTPGHVSEIARRAGLRRRPAGRPANRPATAL